MAYSLDDYNTVPERIAEAKAIYPDGRFQSEIIELPAAFADKFIAVRATFYRTADDPTPAVGLAWEPVPGATNFTRQSELMNAETSAWGRALVAAFAADAKKGIASREEIESRQEEPKPRARSGPQQRTPRQNRPTATETAPVATEPTQVAPDIEIVRWVAKQKLALVDQLGGDKEKAKAIWADVLATYDLKPDQLPLKDSLQFLESDLSIEVGRALELGAQEALLEAGLVEEAVGE